MRSGEGLFKFLQLVAGEGRSVATLFSFGCEIVGLRLAFRTGRRRSRMRALFLGSDLFRGDAHLGGLRRRRRWRRRRRRRLLMWLLRWLAHLLLAHMGHLARATGTARRTRLRDGLLAASSRRMICTEQQLTRKITKSRFVILKVTEIWIKMQHTRLKV